MRLNASKSRLFAGLLGLVAAVAGETNDEEINTASVSKAMINFLPSVFNQSQIFELKNGDKMITWRTVPKGWAVTEINLYKKLAEGDIAIGSSKLASDSNDVSADPNDRSSGGNSDESKSGKSRRDDILQDAKGDVPIRIVDTNNAILPLASKTATFGSDVWNSRLLYLEFGIHDETEAIKSYSPMFIIVNESTPNILADATNIIEDQEPGPAKPDSDPIPLDGSSPTTSPDSDRSTSPSTTSSLEPAEDGSQGGGGGGNKLSKGAIAGIVVGVVVGVGAIAGALVWFFCLRRRQRRGESRGLGGGDGSRAAVMMPEKEAAALSSESRDRPSLTHDQASRGLDSLDHPGGDRAAPYSPYADHHQAVPASPSSGTGPGMAVTTDSQGDLPLAPVHRRQHSGAGTGGAGTPTPPAPITTRYAHLVEEGMTEEEIRRLEEEERQLDAAIEEAGNRHAPPR